MKPTITAILPLYNKGPHIGRALESVFGQTDPVDEVIVIDDASTDDGRAVVESFRDSRLRILSRSVPGPGGYAARNLGIERAKSEWIAFLDADDTWKANAIRAARSAIVNSKERLSSVFGGYDNIEGKDAITSKLFAGGWDLKDPMDLKSFVTLWLAVGQSPMWTSSIVARRSSLVKTGAFPAGKCDRGGDKDTWLRLHTDGRSQYSGEITAEYHRDSVNMVTRSTRNGQRPYLVTTLEQWKDTLPHAKNEIERLINWELFCHARDAWRAKEEPCDDLLRGFSFAKNPILYAAIMTYQHAPSNMLTLSHRIRRIVKFRTLRAKRQ